MAIPVISGVSSPMKQSWLDFNLRMNMFKGIFQAVPTLASGIDVGQGISVGPGKFVKKNKCPMQ